MAGRARRRVEGAVENEELAALRASLLAAERQPDVEKRRQARLSQVVAQGDDLVPYVLARSCSDPRDRVVREDPRLMRVLERHPAPRRRAIRLSEPPADHPGPGSPSGARSRRQTLLAAALAAAVLLWMAIRLATDALLLLR